MQTPHPEPTSRPGPAVSEQYRRVWTEADYSAGFAPDHDKTLQACRYAVFAAITTALCVVLYAELLGVRPQ